MSTLGIIKNTDKNLEFLLCSTSNQHIGKRALFHGNDSFEIYYPMHSTQSFYKMIASTLSEKLGIGRSFHSYRHERIKLS